MLRSLIMLAFSLATTGLAQAATLYHDPLFGSQRTSNITYGQAPINSGAMLFDLKLDLFQPRNIGTPVPAKTPGLVLIHGGGFTSGDKNDLAAVAAGFATYGYTTVSINYRLQSHLPPNGPGPYPGNDSFERAINAAYQDARTAIGWMRDNAVGRRIDADRIGIGGYSAGAITAEYEAYLNTDPYFAPQAVISYAGGMANLAAITFDPADPPAWMYHGDADTTVDIDLELAVKEGLDALGIYNEFYTGAGLGHSLFLPPPAPAGSTVLNLQFDGQSLLEHNINFLARFLVPEPSTFALAALGLAALFIARLRRQPKSSARMTTMFGLRSGSAARSGMHASRAARSAALLLALACLLGPTLPAPISSSRTTTTTPSIASVRRAQTWARSSALDWTAPPGLAFDASGNLYVANSGDNTIRKFGPTRTDLGTFANTGLDDPWGLAFDSAGNLYAANNSGGTVHKFGPTGTDLGTFATISWAGALAFDSGGNLLVSRGADNSIQKFGPTGTDLGVFASFGLSLFDVEFDSAGNLLVVDAYGGSIRSFDPAGTDLGVFATTGAEFEKLPLFLAFAPVPEPSTFALAALGIAGLFIARRRGMVFHLGRCPMKRLACLVLTTLVLLEPVNSSFAAQYIVTDLGTLGGSTSYAYGINNLGHVVGKAYLAGDTVAHAFLYDGAMHDLGTLGGSGSVARGINDSGQVTGSALLPAGNSHAFLYDGTMHDLGDLLSGVSNSYGNAINAIGQVTGHTRARLPSGTAVDHAFLYDGTTMHDLGTLGGLDSYGYGINDAGQVVGISITPSYPLVPCGFLYDGTMHALGGTLSWAFDINNSGQVTGQRPGEAFLYDGTMHNIGPMNEPTLNAHGHVTGYAYGSDGLSAAFLYRDGIMVDLNALIDPMSGWTLQRGTAINDVGQIAGYGTINGQTHAFLITPVPEPSTLALAAVGLLGILAYARRRPWRASGV